jgi:hypothetical protein
MDLTLQRVSARHIYAGLMWAIVVEAVIFGLLGYATGLLPLDTNPIVAFLAGAQVIGVPALVVGLPWALLRLRDPCLRKRDWAANGAVAGFLASLLKLALVAAKLPIMGTEVELVGPSLIVLLVGVGVGIVTALIARTITLHLHDPLG